VNEVILL